MDCSCFTLNDQNFAARSSLICRWVHCRLGTWFEPASTCPDRIEMGDSDYSADLAVFGPHGTGRVELNFVS